MLRGTALWLLQRRRILGFLPILIGLPFAAGCEPASSSSAPEKAKVTVLAAASTAEAIREVAQLFEAKHPNVSIRISTGSSNGLAQQIIAGAPGDVYLSANKRWAEVVEQEGLVADSVPLLTNRMVLIVPRGNPAGVQQLADLRTNPVSRVAIAGEHVPAGIYAEQALRRLDLFDSLRESNKLARGLDVRVTLAYVERAEAEAGIVYATDARISKYVEVISELDRKLHDPVTYPAVFLEPARQNAVSREFFQFLQSSEARGVFERYGFTPQASRT